MLFSHVVLFILGEDLVVVIFLLSCSRPDLVSLTLRAFNSPLPIIDLKAY